MQPSPTRREKLPHSSIEILNRVNEISFNSSLIRKMRAIRFVTQLIDDSYVVNGSLRRIRIHSVAADDVMTKLSVATSAANGQSNGSMRTSTASASNPRWIFRLFTCKRRQSGARPIVSRRPGVCGGTTRTLSQPL